MQNPYIKTHKNYKYLINIEYKLHNMIIFLKNTWFIMLDK